jgi:hypothetical protein
MLQCWQKAEMFFLMLSWFTWTSTKKQKKYLNYEKMYFWNSFHSFGLTILGDRENPLINRSMNFEDAHLPWFFFAGAPEWGFFSTHISDTAQKYGPSDIDLVQYIVMAALTESLLRIF